MIPDKIILPAKGLSHHTCVTPPPPIRKKSIEDVPDDLLAEWSFKLFALMNLTWDYVDTVCTHSASLRLEATKPLARRVRELKREYDRFRYPLTGRKAEKNETEHGLRFEECFRDDFRRLINGIEIEVNKLDLTNDHRLLVISVYQVMTLLEAVRKYARWCDARIAEFGVWVCDCCMVQTEFMELYHLMPLFAGDCYNPDLAACKTTAAILVNRLMNMSLTELLNEDEIIKEKT